MFSHIMIGTNNLERAKVFYDAVLGTLGVPPSVVDRHRIFYRTPTGIFSVSKAINGEPATVGNGSTIGFACNSPARGTRRAWPMAEPIAKTLRACVKVRPNSILPICAIPTATRSAACTGWAERQRGCVTSACTTGQKYGLKQQPPTIVMAGIVPASQCAHSGAREGKYFTAKARRSRSLL